jgi:hypothetical protein
MPYSIGEKGSYGCAGYPVVKEGTSDVMGCHDTAEAAGRQIAAIEANENKTYKEKEVVTSGGGVGIKNPQAWPGTRIKRPKRPSLRVNKSEHGENMEEIKEGDYVMGNTSEGVIHGRVEHIMWEGGTLGEPGTEYAIESMPPKNPAMSVRVFEEEDEGVWEPTAYSIGMMYQDATLLENLQGHNMDDEEEYEDMDAMFKAETFSPTSGMKAAARRALKWKEEGKATGAGTPVGWGRATDIVSGRAMSLSVVRRMFSFFSRHEVDKKGKDFYNTSNPSNGRIMWDAWGGDAGFTWSRGITNRMRDKALFADFGKDYTKGQRFVTKAIGVGSMVSWNSSGGRATGKITRVIRNGSYNVPGTEVTINGTPEDPAAVIRLYRDGKPTGVTVAHRMSTLRAS